MNSHRSHLGVTSLFIFLLLVVVVSEFQRVKEPEAPFQGVELWVSESSEVSWCLEVDWVLEQTWGSG
jgi:hypothetical protein